MNVNFAVNTFHWSAFINVGKYLNCEDKGEPQIYVKPVLQHGGLLYDKHSGCQVDRN